MMHGTKMNRTKHKYFNRRQSLTNDFSDYQLVEFFLPVLNHFHIKHIIFHLEAMVLLVWTVMSFEKFNGRKANLSTAKLVRQLGHCKKKTKLGK
jgi:hypothetical protein